MRAFFCSSYRDVPWALLIPLFSDMGIHEFLQLNAAFLEKIA
jgi:hypothetical protein